MPFGVDELVTALDLETLGRDSFRGRSPAVGWRRVFGGLVVAQALVATERTVEGRPAHALHGSFMLPGDPERPIDFEVERLRDGGSFSTRRCLALQDNQAIFALSASFHRSEDDAFDHAHRMPTVPAPETLVSFRDMRDPRFAAVPASARAFFQRETPMDIRPVDLARFLGAESRPETDRRNIWMKASGRLPADPAIHRAVLAYMSDMTLLDTALAYQGRSVFDPGLQVASLDHAIWFHRPVRADEWLLYSEDTPSASGARGFTRGLIYAGNGDLVASTAQEGLIRRRRVKVDLPIGGLPKI